MSEENLPDLEEPTGFLEKYLKNGQVVVNDKEIEAIVAGLEQPTGFLKEFLNSGVVVDDSEINAIVAGLDEGEDEDDPNLKEALAASLAEATAPKPAASLTVAASKPAVAAAPKAAVAAAPKAATIAQTIAAAPIASAAPTLAAPPTIAAPPTAPAPKATPTEAAAPKASPPTIAAAAPKAAAPTEAAPQSLAAAAPTEAAPQPLAAATAAPMPGGGGSAAAATEAEAVAVKKARQSIQKPEDVEAIVAAFVEKNKVAWTTEWAAENPTLAAQHQTFLHKDESVTNGEVLSEDLKNPLIDMTGFQLKYTSGTNNNCIVNALLTSLSSTFRRLGKKYKDRVSSYFRYEVLEPLYRVYFHSTAFETDEAKQTAVDIYTEIASGMEKYKADKTKTGTYYGGGFISVEVAGVFGRHFGINVLIKDRDQRWLDERLERKASKGGKVGKVATKVATKGGKVATKTATNDDTVVKERGSFTFLGPDPPVDRLIIIHNIDGVHYSSIAGPCLPRSEGAGPCDEYVFPLSLVENWLAASELQGKEGTQRECLFMDDQVLRADHGIFIVLDSENNEKKPGCKHIYVYPLREPMEVEEIKELKKVLRNILSIGKVANRNEDKHGHLKLRAQQAIKELKGTPYLRTDKKYTSEVDLFEYLKFYLENSFINIVNKPDYRTYYKLAKPDPADMTGYKTKYEYYLQNGGRDELLAIARSSVGLSTAATSAAPGGGTTAATPAATATPGKQAAVERVATAKATKVATPATTAPTVNPAATTPAKVAALERVAAAKATATRTGTQKETKGGKGKRKTRKADRK